MPLDKEDIKSLFLRLAPHDGITKTRMDNVKLMRASHPIARTPVLYEPSIVIVCSGQKKGFLGNKIYLYDSAHYLVLTVPLPFFTETNASEDDPLLAISIHLDLSLISELVSKLNHHQQDVQPKGMISTPLNAPLSNVTHRLLMALTSATEMNILGDDIIKEIYYRVLIGEQGAALSNALMRYGQFGKIAKALRYIRGHYTNNIEVKELADHCQLSIPAFHVHFKQVTHSSPIQYIKSMRLQQARLLMIRDNMSASQAAAAVGYESTTQFNREFKRLFGQPPKAEAIAMKAAFSLQNAAFIDTI